MITVETTVRMPKHLAAADAVPHATNSLDRNKCDSDSSACGERLLPQVEVVISSLSGIAPGAQPLSP
eukprot:4787452-Amphidinium_carterae.1